jgi:DNA-directed RNA polymerase subunit beta'
MAYLDHHEANEHFKERVLEGIKSHFPIEGKLQSVHLDRLEVKDSDLHSDDIRKQHRHRVEGKTLSAPVYANLTMRDNETGKVVDKRKMRLAEIPVVTRRYSHIVNGKEYQIDSQWQLKPGAYTRRDQTGKLETQFNVTGRPAFNIAFDPATKQFVMERRASKIPLYPVMQAMGVTDDELRKTWGGEVLEANKRARAVGTAVEKFYRADKKASPPSKEEAVRHIMETLGESKVRPDATKRTLGKSFETVDGEALQLATKKILQVQAGAPEDDRDSLEFKDLRTVGDYAHDKITDYRVKRLVKTRASRKINRAKNIREVVKFDSFNDPIRETFRTAVSRSADQINPIEMVSASQQTTLFGPGGIQSDQGVIEEAKLINPSHFGYIDPLHTPESNKTGVTLRLPLGVRKVGKEPMVPLYNLKTGKTEYVPPTKFAQKRVVLADQVKWEKGKPVPIAATIKMSGRGNEIVERKYADADYVMRHPSQAFNVTTNLLPFLPNTSGNRVSYATRHIEQAIPLENREAPLVQVGTGDTRRGSKTFEELLGRQQAGHISPVDGTITRVTDDGVTIKDSRGKEHEVQIYNNFPLNDAKSVIHSTPTVAVGDKVRQEDVVADSNFTKNGTLALGTNLNVAYIPYKGYNFEDGVVISRSASEKLSSVHMHKPSMKRDEDAVVDPKIFEVNHPGTFVTKQLKKVGKDGVVRVGQKVDPGDPLILSTKPYRLMGRYDLGNIRKSAANHHVENSHRWESDFPGEVVAVHKKGKDVTVHVKTLEPMRVGDKLVGRHGNKGIVSKIEEDAEMPHTVAGQRVDVALNPAGIPSRINPGQVLETAAAKIAKKTGKPYVVNNFDRSDQLSQVKNDLKAHGLTDAEELVDPVTGVKLGKSLVGSQYMLKLMQQIDKKTSARAGMSVPESEPENYDTNLMPSGGSKTGGQSMGALGLYSLLAHGAKANIREMQTWKSEGPEPQDRWQSQHREVWRAIQDGDLLPTPQPTYSYRRFEDMLRAAGINIEKKGHNLQLSPMTDKQILRMSSGAIPRPERLLIANKVTKEGEPKPSKGGLFDERLTGGHGGKKWTHIKLAEPVPNPAFEGPIQKLTGLKKREFYSIVGGEVGVSSEGRIVEVGSPGSVTGGQAIKNMLDKIDVAKELPKAEAELAAVKLPKSFVEASTPKLDRALKKVKYLRALNETGMKPSEAYILHNLPVIPPVMRPPSVLPDGNIKWEDINGLYSKLSQPNDELKDSPLPDTDKDKQRNRQNLYDGVKTIAGIGSLSGAPKEFKGILHQIHGTQPKKGYFQKTMMNRRQDLTMRSVITPEPSLGIDEVGLPRDKAHVMYRPFTVRKLVEMGAAKHSLGAQKVIDEGQEIADKALELVAQERPVLLKRDPILHKYGVQAFKPRLVAGNAIQIHPLVTGGFNADFDGDTMSAYVPISREAVDEAKKMYPSHNLHSEATGKVAYQPSLESALGLYKLSRITEDTRKRFKDPTEVLNAVKDGKLKVDHLATVGNTPVGKVKTTAGRLLIATALPAEMQKAVLTNHKKVLDSDGINDMFSDLAKNHRGDFGDSANRLKDLGNGMSYGAISVPHPRHVGPNAIVAAENSKKNRIFLPVGTHSLTLDDFEPDRKVRDVVLREAQKEVNKIRTDIGLARPEREQRENAVWTKASMKMQREHYARAEKKPTNLFVMHQAKIKPNWDQYKQMALAPVQVNDASGKPVPIPIKRSYSEGLDLGEYWAQSHGARRGTLQKVQEVKDPGLFSKQLINTTMSLVVNGDDCGTERGVALPVREDHEARDVYDRELVRDIKVKGETYKKGTLLTPGVVDKIRAADKNAQLVVRSPLKCEHGTGLCQKCSGIGSDGQAYSMGTNLGIISAQSLGERAVQLTMKAFHTGGVQSSAGSKILNNFNRVKQLTSLPPTIPGSATLAMRSGKVDKIERDKTGARIFIGGQEHHVGRDRDGQALYKFLPGVSESKPGSWSPPRVGQKMEAGQSLSDPSRTLVNPRELYKATGKIEKVQNHLVSELHDIYKKEGVKRVHVETAVKAMSNLTRVRDPGDATGVLRGEYRPTSVVRAQNAGLARAGKKPVEHEPILKGIDIVPLAVQEDWMAKLMHNQKLRDTIMDAAVTNAVSNIHGIHPIPGAAYGAEFGLTRRHALKPGMKHLADVPAHSH